MKKFSRTIENFTCEVCSKYNFGNGFTNHCKFCLHSKHVDINPGDRLNKCKGVMEPVAIKAKRDIFVIKHRCLKCGFVKKNKSAPEDTFEKILELASNPRELF